MSTDLSSQTGQGKLLCVPWHSSVQAKFSLSSLAILLVVLLLLNIYPVEASQNLLFHSKEASMKSQITVMASALIELEELTVPAVERVMELLEPAELSRILVTDPTGLLLYDRASNRELRQNYALIQEIVLALGGYEVVNSRFTGEQVFSNASRPIKYGENIIGAIYIQEEDFAQGQLLSSLRGNLSVISTVAALLAGFFYVVFSVVFTSRMRALLQAIRFVGEGEYGHRLVPKGQDEMAYLAREFNILTDRLQNTEEVRRRFVSDASHELRTPLASIRLLADSILHNEEIRPEMVREFVSDICTESDRLTRITEKLLSLSRLDSLPAPMAVAVPANQVVARVVQSLELISEEAGVSLEVVACVDCFALCTADKYHQICYNLMENALKYTPMGGRVEVRLKKEQGEILLEVRDDGIGIPEEDLPKIFNRFYRVDDARSREAGGTGLGLSIVRDTVRAYGGWVEAQNNHPAGACFTVGLPEAGDL